MNVLFTFASALYFRFFEGVVRELAAKGHHATLLTRRKIGKEAAEDIVLEAVAACIRDTGNCRIETEALLDPRRYTLPYLVRDVAGYANYFHPQHPSPWSARRYLGKTFPAWMYRLVANPLTRCLYRSPAVRAGLRRADKLWAPRPEIKRWLERMRPDIVVASPFIVTRSWEVEYVKAAIDLGLPTAVAVASWDHLVTKGIFPCVPDGVLVWNAALAEEAVALHGLPRERIHVTGASVFDYMFEFRPAEGRESFCRRIGLAPAQRYLVYLASSTALERNETVFVGEMLRAWRARPETRDLALLIRPHPYNARAWKNFHAAGVIVWPKDGDMPVLKESQAGMANSLFFSEGVVGVNTSAMLETAILDKPCLSIRTAHKHLDPATAGHFRHLLAADFLHLVPDYDAAAQVTAELLGGHDVKRENRRRFVKDFIRPAGLDRPAHAVAAEAIENIAAQRHAPEGPRT